MLACKQRHMPSPTSNLRLEIADLERLIARFRPPQLGSFRLARDEKRLLLHLDELQLPTPLLPAIQATFEVKAALVKGKRNVVAVHVVADKLPLGLQALANPFLDKVVEKILPPEAAAFVEIRSPVLFWVHLERIPDHGRRLAETLTLTGLTVPGREGALEASFALRA